MPTPALRRAYAFENLQSFLDLCYLGLMALRTGADFDEMTAAYLGRAVGQNVRHAEVFISPQAHLRRGIAMTDYVKHVRAIHLRGLGALYRFFDTPGREPNSRLFI
jgi:adenosine deaminase